MSLIFGVKEISPKGGYHQRQDSGIFYSSPINLHHDLTKAFELFDGAKDKCLHAKYWLGRAYLNGFGIKSDTSNGFKLIQEAVSDKVWWALFETANLLAEGKGCKGIHQDLLLACEYYKAVTLRANDEPEWIWDYANNYVISHLHANKEWFETESIMESY